MPPCSHPARGNFWSRGFVSFAVVARPSSANRLSTPCPWVMATASIQGLLARLRRWRRRPESRCARTEERGLVIPNERRLTQRWGFPAPSRRVARPDASCVGELLALGTIKGSGPRLAWSIWVRNAIRRNSANRPQVTRRRSMLPLLVQTLPWFSVPRNSSHDRAHQTLMTCSMFMNK
jgi:hypothetical protein